MCQFNNNKDNKNSNNIFLIKKKLEYNINKKLLIINFNYKRYYTKHIKPSELQQTKLFFFYYSSTRANFKKPPFVIKKILKI